MDYELMGVGGDVEVDELRDHPMRVCQAKVAPKFAPLIIVTNAVWGLDPETWKKRKVQLVLVIGL